MYNQHKFILFIFIISLLINTLSRTMLNYYNDISFSKIFINENIRTSKMFIQSVNLYNQRIYYINNEYNKIKKCRGNKKVVVVLLYYKEIQIFIDNNYMFFKHKYYDKLIFFVTENESGYRIYRDIEYNIIDMSDIFIQFPYKFNESAYNPNFKQRGKWNYQHMIRFFFRDIFIHPTLCDADYVMRLDSESIIKTDMNLFECMDKSKIYMHNIVFNDDAYVVKELKEFTKSFVKELKVKIKDKENYDKTFKDTVLLYYNNFEIVKMNFFRNKDMFLFMTLVDLSYGQFIFRWGDAPLRYISLSLFAYNYTKIPMPKSVKYCHRDC